MRITTISICGEADHPLLPQFREHYSAFGDVIIQMGVTRKWLECNGDTSGTGLIFDEKLEQHNAALKQVPPGTDYVFYFDIDEFLHHSDLARVTAQLSREQPDVVRFQMHQFWHDQGYVARGGDGWGFEAWNPRIFRYYPGMQFTSHRPPTLNKPNPKIIDSPIKPNHYSYVYGKHIYRKLLYYNLIYPQFDYQKWFREVWLSWSPQNREALEQTYSVHPSTPNAYTELFTGKHEIQWQRLDV